MVTLPASLNIEKIEDVISKICEVQNNQELELPIASKNLAFGGYAAAIQAVNTWASFNEKRELVIKASSAEVEEQLANIVKSPYKFTAAMMAKTADLNIEPKLDVKKSINSLAKMAIEQQPEHSYGQQHGRLCWYSFVDHSTKGFDRNFYLSSPTQHAAPQSLEQITNIISSMVRKSSNVAGGGVLPKADSVNELGRMFYELFVNTHEHGSRDKNRNAWLKPATRLIYTYGINLSDDAVSNSISHDEVLQGYLAGLKKTDRSTNRFIEVSIIDAGLGYSGRWLADNPKDGTIEQISISEEYEILKKCFKFRSTSSNSLVKGNGLPAVMANLTHLNGFMRVRSNRLALYRDFVGQPFVEQGSDSYEFMDWDSQKCCTEHITQKANATGVSITILIPLIDKSEVAGYSL
ncbi:hypothetical protein [Shewanella gaetbuli]|uniref:ATP-binding protein n=1 Tax=Shewanella gaetbuli TaxID=220752 RepID=A0A9X2CL27_9GAMM|nr:hypothetical protein [Shewanella gaetbuli]MCL1143701.1 hypothetical protein [Shewanella gaetbuli]